MKYLIILGGTEVLTLNTTELSIATKTFEAFQSSYKKVQLVEIIATKEDV